MRILKEIDNLFKTIKVLCMTAVIVIVAACSSISFGYNYSPTLVYFWVNDYVNFDSKQSAAFKQDLDKLLVWHRKTQLMDYAQLLSITQRQLATGETKPEELKRIYKELTTRFEVLANKSVPYLVVLAMSMKPEQFVRMEKKFTSSNETFRKKFVNVSTEKQQELRFKRLMDEFEEWFGSSSKEQEAVLRKASDARPLNNKFFLEECILRQKKILSALRKIHDEKLSKEETMVVLHNVIQDFFDYGETAERKAIYDDNLESNLIAASTAIRIATPAQRAYAHKRMANWNDDIKQLTVSR